MIFGFIGGIGCLSRDTVININRGGKGREISIKELYDRQSGRLNKKCRGKSWNLNIKTKVRSFNGEHVQLHEILDVKCSGIKPVYKLVLNDGKILKATKEHKIMTNHGFVPMKKLTFKHKIMTDTLKPVKGNKKSYKLPDVKIYGGHHINNNHYDNSTNTFEKLIKHIDHKCCHAMESEMFRNFNQGMPLFVNIKSLPVYAGDEKTYDIICKDPYHNFVANGIIVHNSGKTLSMTYYLYQDYLDNKVMFTNYGLKFSKNKKTDETRIIKLDAKFFEDYQKSGLDLINSSIAIDEAHVFIDSRRAMSKKNKLFSKFVTQSRKRSVNLYYTTQDVSIQRFYSSGQVDIRLRKLTDFIVFCRCIKITNNIYIENKIYNNMRNIGSKIIHANKYFKMYDTNEIIDIE